jgi:sugar phosphate isomerase/epimerase
MTAVSTAWNSERHAGWASAAREVLAFGTAEVALDGPALHSDAAAAARVLREVRGRLVALFAPGPARDPAAPVDGGGLVDVRPERRALAVAAAAAAGRAALAAGTTLVVLRAGAVPTLDGSREDRWTERLGREGASPELRAEVVAACDEVLRDRPRFLEALCRSLWELARALPDVTWAVETPSAVTGLPFPDEVGPLLDELRGRRAGYWHDTAHAARFAALGAADARSWIERARGATLGVTLSDWSPPVLGGGGGRVPLGAGVVDWTLLRGQLATGLERVLRVGPEFPAPLVAESLRELRARGL